MLFSIAVIKAQRPLNTTNTSNGVLTEPFFIKPTSTSSKYHPEQRGAGGSHYNNIDNTGGIRNKDRMLSPPYPNFDHLNQPIIGNEHGSSSQPVPATNRLHKVNKSRQSKFGQLFQLVKSSNQSMPLNRGEALGIIKKEREPILLKHIQPEGHYDDSKSLPSSSGSRLQAIQRELNNKTHLHTPSPPSFFYDDIDFNEKLGVICSFDKPCAWTFDTNVNGTNFEVTTGAELTSANITGVTPGPSADNLNDASGHFLHLPLTNETTTRILRSPVFSSTRDRCYMEVFMHQSSMASGNIKIVVERISPSGSWVAAEVAGDDLRRWKYHTFEIAK
jgi:hypothetical protein